MRGGRANLGDAGSPPLRRVRPRRGRDHEAGPRSITPRFGMLITVKATPRSLSLLRAEPIHRNSLWAAFTRPRRESDSSWPRREFQAFTGALADSRLLFAPLRHHPPLLLLRPCERWPPRCRYGWGTQLIRVSSATRADPTYDPLGNDHPPLFYPLFFPHSPLFIGFFILFIFLLHSFGFFYFLQVDRLRTASRPYNLAGIRSRRVRRKLDVSHSYLAKDFALHVAFSAVLMARMLCFLEHIFVA